MRNLSKLIEIAEKAIEVDALETGTKASKRILVQAYNRWKGKNQIEHIERSTLEWIQMMVATKCEYEQLEDAKRTEHNAKRRLRTAIQRHRELSLS